MASSTHIPASRAPAIPPFGRPQTQEQQGPGAHGTGRSAIRRSRLGRRIWNAFHNLHRQRHGRSEEGTLTGPTVQSHNPPNQATETLHETT